MYVYKKNLVYKTIYQNRDPILIKFVSINNTFWADHFGQRAIT